MPIHGSFLAKNHDGVTRKHDLFISFRTAASRAIRVDFLFAAARVVVEVSGRVGHASDADRRKDARRRNQLQQAGFVVLEFTTGLVMDEPQYVVETIRTSLRLPA